MRWPRWPTTCSFEIGSTAFVLSQGQHERIVDRIAVAFVLSLSKGEPVDR